jgi:hypothetical protein
LMVNGVRECLLRSLENKFQLFNENIMVLCTFDLHNKHLSTNIMVLRTFWYKKSSRAAKYL